MQMPLIGYLQTNGFAFAVLVLIFAGFWRRSARYPRDQKIFLAMVAANALLLVFDTGMWAFSGDRSPAGRALLPLSTVAYFILQPIPCMLWALYADLQIKRSSLLKRWQSAVIVLPMLVNAVIAVASLWTDFLFRIGPDNRYTRGDGLLFTAVICYAYLAVTFIHILANQRRIRRDEFGPLLFFALPPTLCGVIQIYVFGVSLVWPGMAVALLLIYLKVLYRRLRTDHLTGLHNRRQLDECLERRIREQGRGGLLAGIMIDVDAFKEINDKYGHIAGDEALERTGDILRESLRNEDFICRYGGDEFAVILEVRRKEDLAVAVGRIREAADRFNQRQDTPYRINLSCGFDVFDFPGGMTAQSFLDHIDRLMYQDKKVRSAISQE